MVYCYKLCEYNAYTNVMSSLVTGHCFYRSYPYIYYLYTVDAIRHVSAIKNFYSRNSDGKKIIDLLNIKEFQMKQVKIEKYNILLKL